MQMSKWVLGLVFAARAFANGELSVEGAGPMEVRYQRVQVDVQDHIAITRVNQQFKNNINAVVEGQYAFRLAPEASVSGFAIWDGETRVPGVIRRKDEARAVYESIKNRRRDPGLLEQVGDNLFQAKVFPIPALTDKKIEIEYREALRVENGTACYRYPLARAYGSGVPVNELVITLDIQDGAEVNAAWSPTPGVAVHHHDPHRVTVSYEVQRAMPESDLLVYYTVKQPLSGLRVRTHRTDDEAGYLQLSIAPPNQGLPPRPKDVVFVIDTSGSMKGSKIDQARRAVEYCLRSLQPDDRFAVLRFSTDVEPMAPRMTQATAKALADATAWVSRLAPAGGTNIDGALTGALATFTNEDDGRPRYLVFLTDGQPTVGNTAPSGILGHARVSNPARARVFTFGIDEAAGMPLLTHLAREHRGESISVTAREDLSSALPLFFGKLTVPLFEDAALEWQGVAVSSVHPKTLPHFYLGRQVTVVGRYRAPGAGKAVLTAKIDGRPVRYEQAVALPEKDAAGSALPRLWAQQEVDALLDGRDPNALNQELKDEIVRLSIAHVFATPFTSFLAVPESEKAQLPPELRRIADSADERLSRANVSPIIEKGERDELTDAQIDAYAQKFTRMLGGEERKTSTLNKDVGSILAKLEPAPRVAPSPAAGPVPAIDRGYRDLERQVAEVRTRVRLLKARIAALAQGATDPRRLGCYVESAQVEPALVPGGGRARIALVVRYASQRPRVVWRATSGRLRETSETGAVWEAPATPGVHEVSVDLVVDGTRTTHTIELVVVEPGRITYAPGFLEARTRELEAALAALRAELAAGARELEALVAKLTPAVAKAIEAMAVLTKH